MNFTRSSIWLHSCQGILLSSQKALLCNPCLRNELSPFSQEGFEIFRLMRCAQSTTRAEIQIGSPWARRRRCGARRSLDRLDPIALCVLHVAVFCASIPIYAASYVVRHIALTHFSPRDVAF